MSGELGINHTGALTKMLSAVGEKIDIEVNDAQGKNYAMKIKEGSTTMTFMLADTSVIPAVPTINAEPEYEVTIDIDDEFVNKFIKAKMHCQMQRILQFKFKMAKLSLSLTIQLLILTMLHLK